MQDCTHLSRFALVSTVFPMQKRKKVHRLLYHNLCTNVAKDCYFNKKEAIVNCCLDQQLKTCYYRKEM